MNEMVNAILEMMDHNYQPTSLKLSDKKESGLILNTKITEMNDTFYIDWVDGYRFRTNKIAENNMDTFNILIELFEKMYL